MDDAHIEGDVGRRRHEISQRRQVGGAAYRFQFVLALEILAQGDQGEVRGCQDLQRRHGAAEDAYFKAQIRCDSR